MYVRLIWCCPLFEVTAVFPVFVFPKCIAGIENPLKKLSVLEIHISLTTIAFVHAEIHV